MQLWTGVSADKDITTKFKAEANLEHRLRNNWQKTDNYFGELGGSYKLAEGYSPSFTYRFSNFAANPHGHRIAIDQNFKYQRFNDRFDLRVRYQYRFENTEQSASSRFRFRVGYTHLFSKRFRVYARAEYFYSLRYHRIRYDRERYQVGTRVRITKGHFLDLRYIFQRELNVKNPEYDYILSVSWIINL